MSSRTDRHRELAERGVRAHQGLTEAHVAGQQPTVQAASATGKATVLYTPQLGEHVIADGFSFGATEGGLRELQMFWQKFPDFGVKEAKVFASESGWAQVLYWAGTAEDGSPVSAQEVDVVTTDDDFDVVRYEIYSESTQWQKLMAVVRQGQSADLSYGDLMAQQPGGA